MAPTPYYHHVGSNNVSGGGGGGDCSAEEPLSRTYQYRKVMKPMLERKRRARINRCLDELKELMVTALQSEGENVSKLEKADILELTVRHLHNLKRQHQLILPTQEQSYADRFRAGFNQCAQEVTHLISTPSSLSSSASAAAATAKIEFNDPSAGRKLLQHLGTCVRKLDNVAQNVIIQHQQQNNKQQHQQTQQQQQQQNRRSTISSRNHRNDDEHVGGPMWRPW